MSIYERFINYLFSRNITNLHSILNSLIIVIFTVYCLPYIFKLIKKIIIFSYKYAAKYIKKIKLKYITYKRNRNGELTPIQFFEYLKMSKEERKKKLTKEQLEYFREHKKDIDETLKELQEMSKHYKLGIGDIGNIDNLNKK